MYRERMARNTKKKLAIFAGTSKCLIYAEAKFCASEMTGETKYYECSRTEYCCGIGCCMTQGLHFHHLWYYWILVIIMFLVCSGGGWWYRYWLQGRYRAAASTIPNRSSNPRAQSSLRGPPCQGQRARITYNSARNTVLLHRMWKGPQRNGAMPAYNGSPAASSHYQNMNVVLNDANCPYYQLYGPPPSYETVIAQTRGKISNPVSPESSGARINGQSASVLPNSSVQQCFSYACNSSTRLNAGLEQNAVYQSGNAGPRHLENSGAMPLARFPSYLLTDGGAIRPNLCVNVPFNYQEQSFVPGDGFARIYQGTSTNYIPYPLDKSSDTSDPENQSYEVPRMDRYTMVNIDCTAGSSREPNVWEPNDRSVSKSHANGKSETAADEVQQENDRDCEQRLNAMGTDRGYSSMREHDSESTVNSSEDFEPEFSRSRRMYGGSLKVTGRYAGNAKCEEYSVHRAFSKTLPRSCEGLINTEPATATATATATAAATATATATATAIVTATATAAAIATATTTAIVRVSQNYASPLEETADTSANSFQSNPSNNVILESFVSDGGSSSTENVEDEQRCCPSFANVSTNSDFESKHRLDRSKSLD